MKKLIASLFAAIAAVAFPLAASAAVVDLNATSGPLSPSVILGRQLRFTNANMYERGDNCGVMVATVTEGASDSNGSTYRVFNNLDPNLIPLVILVGNTANTGATSSSLGLYAGSANGATGGAAVAANVFMNAVSLASAHASLNPNTAVDGMSAVLPANVGQALWQLAGDAAATTRPLGYDLTLTANTAGTSGGTVTVLMIYSVPTKLPQ